MRITKVLNQKRSGRWENVHDGQWFTEVPLDVVANYIMITVESLQGSSFKEGFHEIEVYTGNSMSFQNHFIKRFCADFSCENSKILMLTSPSGRSSIFQSQKVRDFYRVHCFSYRNQDLWVQCL